MASIYDWSTVAGSNGSADSGINFAEGQASSTVNDSARQVMGRVAEILGDIGGSLSAGGTADGLTVTANSAFTTYANGRIVSFKATADNTGAATLSVNGIGAKAIRKMDSTGDVALAAGEIQNTGIYVVQYSTALNAGAGAWLLVNPTPSADFNITGDLTVSGGDINIAPEAGFSDIASTVTNAAVQLSGGTVFNGGVVRAYGSTHATQANDIEFFSGGLQKYLYDFSALQHQFSNGQAYFADGLRTNSNTTDIPGNGNNTTGLGISSVGALSANVNGSSHSLGKTSDGTIVRFTSAGDTEGSVSIAGSVTSFNTSSDERKKRNFRAFDAGPILDAIDVGRFEWIADGIVGYGVLAQQARPVFPSAVLEGDDGYLFADYSKFVPLLMAEVKALRSRVAELES